MFRPPLHCAHQGLVSLLALAVLGLCLETVQAQPGFPPRGSGNPPGMNPRMPGTNGPIIKHVWRCSGCGHEIGDGPFPPAQCPFCGARIVNGVGPSQPGYGGGNGPNNPGAMNPGGMPPGNMPGAVPPAANNPPFQPVAPPVNVPEVPVQRDAATSSPGSAAGLRIAVVVVLILAGLLAVLVLVVVAVIVIYNLNRAGQKPPRPARRRRRLAEQY